jgi:hypothetical protein
MKYVSLAVFSGILFLTIAVLDTHAAFDDPPLVTEDKKTFDDVWEWDFKNGPVNPSKITNRPFWSRELESSTFAGLEGQEKLVLQVVHVTGPDPGDVDRNPAQGSNSVVLGPLQKSAKVGQQAKVAQFTHPKRDPPHVDIVSLSATIPPPDPLFPPPDFVPVLSFVQARGKHSDPWQGRWSFTTNKGGPGGKVTVQASYDKEPHLRPALIDGSPPKAAQDVPVEGNGGRVEGPLKGPKEKDQPTDYVVKLTINPTTELTLAFLGEVDGVPGKLDLVAGFDLFGNPEITAPMFHAANSTDLFVAVDLSQWLSFPTVYDASDTFSITAGKSDQLPGYLFSTSPIDFDPVAGYTTTNPYEGEVYVSGTVDGKALQKVNDKLYPVNCVGCYTYHNTTGCHYGPGAPSPNCGDTYPIEATFQNVSSPPVDLKNLIFRVTKLDGSSCDCTVSNADGGAGRVDAQISVPAEALGPNGVLAPGKTFTQRFNIKLARHPEGFTFFVDVYGDP